MMFLARRGLLLSLLACVAVPSLADARDATDSAGRTFNVPDKITKVMAAGPPASAMLYVVAPHKMIGWVRSPRADEKPYLIPATHDLPELGRLTGRGDTANVEVVLKAAPDLVLDFGSITPTYVSLANATQQRTGIPYALIDGRFENTSASLRLLGSMLGAAERGEELAAYADRLFARLNKMLVDVPEASRPRVYLARGPEGLETGLKGSINTEILERAGGRNVADPQDGRRGIANISPEQMLLWKPDVIVTWDRSFFRKVSERPDGVWEAVPAVANKRVYLAPAVPFGWIDSPPSVNRLIGLAWMANLLYPDRFPFEARQEVRAFYKLFYQVDLSDAQLDTLIAWSDGKPPAAAVKR